MRIATWNVNSIRTREQRVLDWLSRYQPDALCLQETKVVDEVFPREVFESAGYHAVTWGQKTYNGVAILSRTEPVDVLQGMDDGDEDDQARVVSATIDGVRVISAYVPNGKTVDSDKYAYKLRWLDRLEAWLQDHHDPTTPVALCGDFNMACDARDMKEEAQWEGTVLYNDEMRDRYARLLAWGFADTFRQHHQEGELFSWWDYRGLAFPRNDGCRIDYVMATAPLVEKCSDAFIDRDQRKKGACPEEKPSDHVPVVADFDD